MSHIDSLQFAYGGPLGSGVIRAQPEDFIVREHLGFEASGAGEHMLLLVRKRGANTKWVARQLAAKAGARVRDVGFSGLKDRHAVTEQAFTIPARKQTPDAWIGFSGEGFEVTHASLHQRKLPRGSHRGNYFELIVRDIEVDPALLNERLDLIRVRGVPNYFGEQRFGHDDHNLRVAEQWLCHGSTPADRDERSFAISAARSALFNAVLSRRVADGTWDRLLTGEVVNLDGTGSVFVCDVPDVELDARCARLDVHPTGPLCGVGHSRVSKEALAVEGKALMSYEAWQSGLERINVQQQRRALRLAVHELTWTYEHAVLNLKFRLSRGAFATAVLREIVRTNDNDSKLMGDE